MTMISPSLEEFRKLASRGNLIPVVAEIVSDVETPVGAFQKIGRDGFSFLFESAERNEESGRFSFIGINPLLIVSQRERDVAIREKSGAATNRSTFDPLGELQKILSEFRFVPRDDIPHFQGGAVGFVGYDVIRFFEPKTTIHSRDDLGLPEMMFVIAGALVVFDHRFRKMRVITLGDMREQSVDDAYHDARKQIDVILEKLAMPSRLRPISAQSDSCSGGLRPPFSAPRAPLQRNARDLLADPKERAEHVMLIDLARNDLGRIAQIGSVRVTEQMTIERYSHVMHIVSHVEARLRDGLNAFSAFRSTFPAGTVSGAPKIRAMQIIAELEKTRRGFYAGAVGWFGFDGNCDSCIALRSVVLKNGKAFVQAGAGIVADSEPWREREETERKAMAVLAAIARAKEVPR